MQRLLLFLLKYRAFLVFIFLEVVCFWLTIRNNQYQKAAFFNSANTIAASLMEVSSNVNEYFSLKEVNERLVHDNVRLREQLTNLRSNIDTDQIDTESPATQFSFIPAKVVNKTVSRFHNYITIDKGKATGVKRGLGVIGPDGIVGKVKAASEHYSTITSLLHTDVMVSSVIQSNNTFCTTNWDGRDPVYANLLYVPRHIPVQKGDTVVTSGYNAIFPEGIKIGVIEDIELAENATFYEIRIRLTTEFNRISYVYVVQNQGKAEKDSLEIKTTLER